MGSTSPARTRRLLRVLALCALVIGMVVTLATAAGPGGWDHLGDRGTPGSDSLDLVASALTVTPGALYVGGEFTDAGGVPNADRIATWNGSSWGAVSSSTEQIENGRVSAIAVSGGKVYAGGSFTDAGDDPDADFLAVWDGASWAPFCNDPAPGPAFTGNVTSLQIIGQTLYVGGSFFDGAHIPSADFLLACDLASGASSTTVADPAHPFSGSVYALTADSNGTLYAGGGFIDLENAAAADNVARLPPGGTWQPMGAGITTFVRGLTAVGTDVYVGTDAIDVAGIPQADHVARWNGSAWFALGAGSGGANGWFPTTASIYGLAATGSNVFVTGTFLDADGDARADNVAFFDGFSWHPVGSDGAGNGPWSGTGLALAIVDRQLYAAGNFTSAGGDPQAHSVASFSLTQVIAYPTPTVTPGPPPVATPTVTPSPPPPPDAVAPRLASLALSQSAFAAFSSGPSVRAARTLGTVITYRLSEAAIVTFRVQRVLGGRRTAGRCVAPTRANRTKPRCKRYRTLRAGFRHSGKAGVNRFRFSGRLAGRELRPGGYRLVSTAKDAAGNKSKPERRLFRIIR